MEFDLVGLLFVAGIVALVALLIRIAISIARKKKKKRTNELKELALRSGFSFSENVDMNTCDFGEFDIFRNSADIKVWNMLTKAESGFGMKIFDCRRGSGKNKRPYAVFMVEQTKSLPAFILRKNTFLNNPFGLKAIVFNNFKKFSDEYFLVGNDKSSIRNVFNEKVIRHFENHKLEPDETIATDRNRIVYYQRFGVKTRLLKAEALQAKLEEVNELLSVFIK